MGSQSVWDALEGVPLRRRWYEPLCLVCLKRGRRPGRATCSPRCNERWARFLRKPTARPRGTAPMEAIRG